MPEDRTAILFFSHRPEREWQNKWFVRRDHAKSRQVAEAFYEHTRQAAAESPFPVLEVTDAQQRGDSFGTRLANAVADAFAEGYDRVVAVGSDCPSLHEVDWESVEARLEAGCPVLGPTPDDEGTYLIGMTRSQFDRQVFAALPWQTPALLAALRCHLADTAGTPPVLLAPRDDVNSPEELRRLLRRPPSSASALVAHLRHVLGSAHQEARPQWGRSMRPALRRRSRAPPSSLTSTRVG